MRQKIKLVAFGLALLGSTAMCQANVAARTQGYVQARHPVVGTVQQLGVVTINSRYPITAAQQQMLDAAAQRFIVHRWPIGNARGIYFGPPSADTSLVANRIRSYIAARARDGKLPTNVVTREISLLNLPTVQSSNPPLVPAPSSPPSNPPAGFGY